MQNYLILQHERLLPAYPLMVHFKFWYCYWDLATVIDLALLPILGQGRTTHAILLPKLQINKFYLESEHL